MIIYCFCFGRFAFAFIKTLFVLKMTDSRNIFLTSEKGGLVFKNQVKCYYWTKCHMLCTQFVSAEYLITTQCLKHFSCTRTQFFFLHHDLFQNMVGANRSHPISIKQMCLLLKALKFELFIYINID